MKNTGWRTAGLCAQVRSVVSVTTGERVGAHSRNVLEILFLGGDFLSLGKRTLAAGGRLDRGSILVRRFVNGPWKETQVRGWPIGSSCRTLLNLHTVYIYERKDTDVNTCYGETTTNSATFFHHGDHVQAPSGLHEVEAFIFKPISELRLRDILELAVR